MRGHAAGVSVLAPPRIRAGSPRPDAHPRGRPLGARTYLQTLRIPGALAFAVPGFVGRLPLSMLGIGSVVLVEQTYGGYGLAGAVAATVALSQALTAPLLGRVIDRVGQAVVLLPALLVHVVGLVGLLLAAGARAPAWVLVVTAFLAGGALPPISACVRARWAALLTRQGRSGELQTAFAFEAVVDELVFILGPVLVISLAVAFSPTVGLGSALAFVVVGTLAFSAARGSDPGPREVVIGAPRHLSAIRSPGLRVVVAVFLCVGALFGSVEVVMVAFAAERQVPGAAGLLLGCVAGGSLISGLVYGGLTFRSSVDERFRIALLLLATGMVPLVPLAASDVGAGAMVPVAVLAGLAISPTLIAGYALIERVVRPAALTEGFTWLTTALGVGMALGASTSGVLVDLGGSPGGFLVPLAGGCLAALAASGGARALEPRTPGAAEPAPLVGSIATP
jgi:hypothetical protein